MSKKIKKPTVKQVKTAKLILGGKTKTAAAMEVYDIDPTKNNPETTALQLANTSLERYIDYEGKSICEILDTPEINSMVHNKLKENIMSDDGRIANAAIKLWAELCGKLIKKTATLRGEITSSSIDKWKKGS